MTNVDDLIRYTSDRKSPLVSTIEKLTDLRVSCFRALYTPGAWTIILESSLWSQRLDAPRHRKIRTSRMISDREIESAQDALNIVEHNIEGCVKDMIEHLVLRSHKLTDIEEARERRWEWLRVIRDVCRLPFQYFDKEEETWITRRPWSH